jgi:hypothetical protein
MFEKEKKFAILHSQILKEQKDFLRETAYIHQVSEAEAVRQILQLGIKEYKRINANCSQLTNLTKYEIIKMLKDK